METKTTKTTKMTFDQEYIFLPDIMCLI